MFEPSRQSYLTGPPQPLTLSFPLGASNPYELSCHLDRDSGPTFLLESGLPPNGLPCYSFFGEHPYAVLRHQGGETIWTESGRQTRLTADALGSVIDRAIVPGMASRKELPPFIGGAVGFLSYDAACLFEPFPRRALADLPVPEIQFAFFEIVGAVEHTQGLVHLCFTPPAERFATVDRAALYDEGCNRLTSLHQRLCKPVSPVLPDHGWRSVAPQAGQARHAYMDRVRRCQEYIRAGDIYQANLSHRFAFDWPERDSSTAATRAQRAAQLYQRVRRVNPSPFAALMHFDDLALVSASPERLVRQQGRIVETRPIAGTRPRGAGPWEDDRLKHDLLANVKERAEHLMLVDLERNDLGRICAYGTVTVDEFMTVEQYSHVSHLVSNVRGTLRPDVTGPDVLRAVFPGGTITGVPKVRCMHIIEELEPVRRGLYTGSLGYVSRTGDMDFNILIRTMLLTGQAGYLQVGAGIVADSDPAREYDETLHKGQAFFAALDTPSPCGST